MRWGAENHSAEYVLAAYFALRACNLENRNQQTNKPTAERVLKAFDKISLTIIQEAAGNEIRRWLTSLSAVQQDILYRLGLDPDLYWRLEIQHRSVRLSE